MSEILYFPHIMSAKELLHLILWVKEDVTHGILVDSSPVICWRSPFVILGVLGLFVVLFYF